MSTYSANYNSYALKSDDYHITKIDVGNPKSKVNKYELVRADGQIVTNQNYGERKISIEGKINATSLDDMNTKLDTLKYRLQGIDNYLDIVFDSQSRRYIATVENFTYKTRGYLCEYEIDFTADTFGKDTATTSLTMGTYTSSNTGYANTIGGTFVAVPTIDLTVNQIEPYWTNAYLQFTNSTLNQRMRITREWNWYDRVVINGALKTVTLYPTTKTELDLCDVITGWTSAHTLSLEAAAMKEGVGALKIVMGSAAATSYAARLNSTAVDLSSTMGKVIVPVFIPTPTSGTVASVDLYLGSNSTLGTNYDYFRKTTTWNGSAIASNAWNYFVFDLSTAATGSSGTAVRTAIISIQVLLNATATMQLNGWLVDYITLQKASIVGQALDYEGQFVELGVGSTTLTVSDEFTSRNITMTGEYTKRYL
jgi:hypothetical protein